MKGYLQIERPLKNRVRCEDREQYIFIDEEQYPLFVSRGGFTQTLQIDTEIITKKNIKRTRKTVHRIGSNGFDLHKRPLKTKKIKHTQDQSLLVSLDSRSVWILPTNLITSIEIPVINAGDILVQGNNVYIYHDSSWVFLGIDSGVCDSILYVQVDEPIAEVGDRWLNTETGLFLTRVLNEASIPVWSELYYASGICEFGDIVYSANPPATPNLGDRWFDSDSGTFYTYIVDSNDDYFWVDTSA